MENPEIPDLIRVKVIEKMEQAGVDLNIVVNTMDAVEKAMDAFGYEVVSKPRPTCEMNEKGE